MEPQKTPLGAFAKDPLGMWHYAPDDGKTSVEELAQDAVAHKPEGVVWFWAANGDLVYCPISPDDDAEKLSNRWKWWIFRNGSSHVNSTDQDWHFFRLRRAAFGIKDNCCHARDLQ